MKKYTKKSIIIGLCLVMVLALSLDFVLAAKPESPPGQDKGKSKDEPPMNPDVSIQIQAELDYIINSSWTEENKNSKRWQFLQTSDNIYGAINSNRIPSHGAPNRWGWVSPGISAMAAVGMMQGITYLYNNEIYIANYDTVIDKFFLTWELAHRQAQNNDLQDPDYGAFMDRVNYDSSGNYETLNPLWKTDVTAQMLIANYKYYEYNNNINQSQQAGEWLDNAWSIQKNGADYLVRMYDSTPAGSIHLLPGNSSVEEYTTWIHFAANAVPGLRATAVWAQKVGAPYSDYDRVANDLVIGIQSMKDTSSRSNYFRFIPYVNGSYGSPTYGENIDQLTFVPYETGAVPVDNFAGQVSDWWTNGDQEISMTDQTTDSTDWRYFGTHWKYYFAGNIENNNLYPGAGFQLAKVEWKYGNNTSNAVYLNRSSSRLNWGKSLDYSSLWWFMTGEDEAKTPNGFADWRDSTNYSNTAEGWARFVDTSAYFIEALLMNKAGIDTDYNPL